jgi:putative DNA primase/helicase
VDEVKEPFERKRDGTIREKMQKELPGILAWLIRGCLEWQRIGLQPPELVKAATAAYRSENDSLVRFIAECCECEKTREAQAKVLFEAYIEWCDESGVYPLSINKFTDRMLTLFDRYDRNRKKFYVGICLKTEKI